MSEATIEPGQSMPTQINSGIYLLYADVLAEKIRLMDEERIADATLYDMSKLKKSDDMSVNESGVCYL